jgi:hypothetical protein
MSITVPGDFQFLPGRSLPGATGCWLVEDTKRQKDET